MLRTKMMLALMILLCWHVTAMAKISVRSDPAAVQLGEAFRLIFTLEDPKPHGIPNLIPLEENFTIVGTERNTAYTIVNGETHSVNQWIVVLTAKKTGVLPIPSIQFGSQESTATTINVSGDPITTTPDAEPGIAQDEVMLKTSVDKPAPFINQQVIYTVKLYNSQRLLDAEYTPPQVEDAVLVPMGDGRRYQTTIDGQSYAVEEQQYAIFPQKSGVLNIISPSFKALIFDAVPRRINVHAKTSHLDVKAAPANLIGKNFLPAKQLALTEIYNPASTALKQGSTLTRTVTIQAAGVPAQLLPIPAFDNSSQFNAYAEKPDLRNAARQQDLIGRSDIKVTYVLNKAGSITIPQLQVPWFNTDTGKEEIASLPEYTIQVEAVKGAVQPTEPTAPVRVEQSTPKQTPLSTEVVTIEHHSRLAWWLAGGFALAWVITFILYVRRRCSVVKRVGKKEELNNVHKACIKNNPKRAHTALLRWAAVQWPDADILNLHQVAKLVHDSTLKKQLNVLSNVLYSKENNIQWQGDALWRSLKAYLNSKPTAKGKSTDLPPINPGC